LNYQTINNNFMNETEKRVMKENERDVKKARREGNVDKLQELLDNMPENIRNYKHLKDVTKKAISLLNEKKAESTKPVTLTEAEIEQTTKLEGSTEALNELTAPVDAEINTIANESAMVIEEAEKSINEVSPNTETLNTELVEKQKEFEKVTMEFEKNEEEIKKMESYIKIAEGFLDLNLPKETIVKLLGDSGATQEEILLIMGPLLGTIDTPAADAAPVVAENQEVTPVTAPESTPVVAENTTTNPETVPVTAETTANNDVIEAKNINETGRYMLPANRGFFEKMSEKGRSIAATVYKGINMIPVVNRLVAKIGISYNQYFINAKEGRSSVLKDKMDGLDLEMKTFDQSKTRMIEIMENLKKNGNPGYAPLALEIKKMERQESKLANKRDQLQSKIELKENKIKIYTNKRDAIADKMIGKYENKLSPIEGKLEVINNEREKMNLYILGREIELERDEAYFNNLEKDRNQLMESLTSTGKSIEKAGRNASIKILNKQIEKGREKITKTREELAGKQRDINEKIAKIDAQAQPHRDRRNQFIRVKEGRPIDWNLEERNRLQNEKTMAETSSHTRKNEAETVSPTAPKSIDTNSDSSIEEAPSLSGRISKLNEYLTNNNLKKDLQIDEVYLLNNMTLTKETTVNLGMFKKVVEQYYRVKKIPENDYRTLLNNLK